MRKLLNRLASVLIAACSALSCTEVPAQVPEPVYFEKFIAKRVGGSESA